jgi:hypothetical protein
VLGLHGAQLRLAGRQPGLLERDLGDQARLEAAHLDGLAFEGLGQGVARDAVGLAGRDDGVQEGARAQREAAARLGGAGLGLGELRLGLLDLGARGEARVEQLDADPGQLDPVGDLQQGGQALERRLEHGVLGQRPLQPLALERLQVDGAVVTRQAGEVGAGQRQSVAGRGEVLVGVLQAGFRLLDVEPGGAAALGAQAGDVDGTGGQVARRGGELDLQFGLPHPGPGAGDLGQRVEAGGARLRLGQRDGLAGAGQVEAQRQRVGLGARQRPLRLVEVEGGGDDADATVDGGEQVVEAGGGALSGRGRDAASGDDGGDPGERSRAPAKAGGGRGGAVGRRHGRTSERGTA